MPVFDFSDKPVKNEDTVCTYTAFQSNASAAPDRRRLPGFYLRWAYIA